MERNDNIVIYYYIITKQQHNNNKAILQEQTRCAGAITLALLLEIIDIF
jgi:hypothetical protein